MEKKIVYVVGGLISANGMGQVLSQKINYLAEHTDFRVHMILTEKKDSPWYYRISDKVESVNFDINFDELDTMPLLQKIIHYRKKQCRYKKLFTKYLMEIRADITISTCRREINFINNIKDGSKKVGEIHFNKINYREFHKNYLPDFINSLVTHIWKGKLIKEIKRLDEFVVLSDEDKANWTEINNIKVIPNPLRYYPNSSSTCINKKVIAVGRYTYQKGFDLLIDSWVNVSARHPDWTLDIYGTGDFKFYQDLAKRKGVGTSVYCHDVVKDIYDKYLESSIFVFSSRYEGFGLVLAEAMSCGIPSVSFDCPCGPKDMISDGLDGFIVNRYNLDDFSQKICFLIEHDDKRKSMGKNAQENMKKFSEKGIMEEWINLFNKL